MFTKSAEFYDAVYGSKDYAAETERLQALIQQFGRRPYRTLLDVACGTGGHIEHLSRLYEAEGLDLDSRMLAVARRRNPNTTFHLGEMSDFDLDRQFDIVVCLFSSIGYAKTKARMNQAIQNMARHVRAGGLVIVEPWIGPDEFITGHVGAHFVDQPGLKIARMHKSHVRDGVSILNFHYLVATEMGVVHFTELHELGLFTHDEYMGALRAAYLEPYHDQQGLMGRGLYVGAA